ncbi:src kinase-associated phosphoprotein 2-like isoform X2 [Zootermopsis nevadensis]|uniref:src kinase-associated phosphoprotein 2-like isoform X2 n=1 Tax=Zootermopsis nevadensis TaxID=136037 RepID=UPI000B8EBF27|nr:src kinase-associated phosphoprotein 2-like isoform X2 [Zootermopsis nevadensis]
MVHEVEMGRFLGETLVGEPLSPRAEVQRAGLLQRLEPHIRRSEVTASPNTPPPYLDMNGPKGAREEYVDAEVNADKVEEEYEEFPELSHTPIPAKLPVESQTSLTSSSGQSEDYVNLSLPYSELRTMTNKCGPLWRKEKFIFLDQWRRCCAGIYGHVVLLYNSERDAKPSSSFDVQGYDARPLTTNNYKDPKRKVSAFEIVCPGKRTYQFVARTAKDMGQWVVAIRLASTQPTPTVPHRVHERTLLGKRQLPSLPDSDSETYDDVGSTINFNDNRQKNYEPVQSDGEELYHDIADVYQKGSQVQSKSGSELKHTEEEPSIPPVPQEDPLQEDAVYDDIGIASSSSVYCNMIGASAGELQQQEPEESNIENNEEEGDDIYDDIGFTEQDHVAIKLSAFRQEGSGGNGARIQHIIKKMEASLGNGNKRSVGYHMKHEPLKQIETEELYEPIENGTVETSPAHPELQTRSNVVW